MENNKLLDIVFSEVSKIGGRPIYVTKFGSELYGLNTSNSDDDLFCVYLPPKIDLLMSGFTNILHSFRYKTNPDNSKRNSSEDLDINFISLQKFLKSISTLEVVSCDVLFSYTNKDTILLDDNFGSRIYSRRNNLINISNSDAFIGYGINQVKRYGLRGTGLGITKEILRVLEPYKDSHDKLETVIELILAVLPKDQEGKLWEIVQIPASTVSPQILKGFKFFQSIHTFSVTIKEVYQRILGRYNKYGERSKLAEKNEGIDWKASSHGLRSLINYEKLIVSGEYSYPFSGEEKDLLMKIKLGQLGWFEYEKIFLEYQERLTEYSDIPNNFNVEAVKQVLQDYYGSI